MGPITYRLFMGYKFLFPLERGGGEKFSSPFYKKQFSLLFLTRLVRNSLNSILFSFYKHDMPMNMRFWDKLRTVKIFDSLLFVLGKLSLQDPIHFPYLRPWGFPLVTREGFCFVVFVFLTKVTCSFRQPEINFLAVL